MPNFVELWVYLSATPLLGLTVALVEMLAVCVLAYMMYPRLAKVPWAIPVLCTVLTLPIVLLLVWAFGFGILIVMVVSLLAGLLVTALALKLFFRNRTTVSTATEKPLAQHPKDSNDA